MVTWQPIQDTTAELREGCAALENSLEQIFFEVDEMRQELVDRLQEVEQTRQRLDSREAAMGQELEESAQLRDELRCQASELTQAQDELARVRDELEQQRDGAFGDLERSRDELARIKEELEQQLSEATGALELVRDELAQATEALEQQQRELAAADDSELRDELESLRALLKTSQAELEGACEERDELRRTVEGGRADRVRLAELESELADARRQIAAADVAVAAETDSVADDCAATMNIEQMAAFEKEREALEAELELVRGHAAELNETVVEQQRAMNSQKTEFGGELQQLRRLVEQQAELFADRATDHPEVPVPLSEQDSTPASDPVVNSVMAQFAKLQKDVAQRRQQRK